MASHLLVSNSVIRLKVIEYAHDSVKCFSFLFDRQGRHDLGDGIGEQSSYHLNSMLWKPKAMLDT